MSEACRIGIYYRGPGAVDVGAPMKHKDLCYDMLRDARGVVERTAPEHFKVGVTQMAVVMDMTGRVDVSAPLPPDALGWLGMAKNVIERYDDDSAPEMRPFNAAVMGT